jgi:NNP family nitrate/nitrite transporter-like MFS transporter
MVIGFLCGMGGGDFSSFMPSTSIFFPKRLQGTAMGIQAGLGNFGVSIVQFVAPWIIGFAALGAAVGGPQAFTKVDVLKDIAVTKDAKGVVTDIVAKRPDLAAATVITREGDVIKSVTISETSTTKDMKVELKKNSAGLVTDVVVKKVVKKDLWLQNAAFVWVPFLVVAFILSVIFLRSLELPTRGFMGQFEILSNRNRARVHTWNCTITYICSFGSFSGFSGAFPMLIKTLYGGFDGAPDPLAYAYIGPLLGGLPAASSTRSAAARACTGRPWARSVAWLSWSSAAT